MNGDRRQLLVDLATLDRRFTSRRQVLQLLGAAGLLPVLGCGGRSAPGSGLDGGRSGADGGDACSVIPGETAGPFPGDGTNGANALALAGIVRSDIRTSIGSASRTADGVPLTVTLTLVDAVCAPLAGLAVYLWQCDRAADYSMYTGSAVDENYLRGVQETDVDGVVTFASIFPACYPGRWPHIHFEIYSTLDAALSGQSSIHVSQLALERSACQAVYATAGYQGSATNLGRTSLESDGVFGDGATGQLASTSGSIEAGYAARLMVGVPA